MRSLLFQPFVPASYWVESLHTATYLFTCLPTKVIHAPTPHFALFGTTPSCDHLCVFGVRATPTFLSLFPISLPPAPPVVSSLVTPLITKGIDVMTSPLIVP